MRFVGRFSALCFALFLVLVPQIALAARPDEIVVVDTLGLATPDTHFDVAGAGGQGILADQFTGPQFVLSQSTKITQIGMFVNNCGTIVNGVPNCLKARAFIVEILAATSDGLPDTSRVLDQARLVGHYQPLQVNFITARMNVVLPAGTYYAIVRPQRPQDGGFVLGTASSPFGYQADSITMGNVTPSGSAPNSFVPAAVRILGNTRH